VTPGTQVASIILPIPSSVPPGSDHLVVANSSPPDPVAVTITAALPASAVNTRTGRRRHRLRPGRAHCGVCNVGDLNLIADRVDALPASSPEPPATR
jgi:hypothetical protein